MNYYQPFQKEIDRYCQPYINTRHIDIVNHYQLTNLSSREAHNQKSRALVIRETMFAKLFSVSGYLQNKGHLFNDKIRK